MHHDTGCCSNNVCLGEKAFWSRLGGSWLKAKDKRCVVVLQTILYRGEETLISPLTYKEFLRPVVDTPLWQQ